VVYQTKFYQFFLAKIQYFVEIRGIMGKTPDIGASIKLSEEDLL